MILNINEEPLFIEYISPDDGSRGVSYATPEAAAFDLRSAKDCVLMPNSRAVIGTGIKMVLPVGTTGLVLPRSGLTAKGIDVKIGVVDSDYRGEVKVIIENRTDVDLELTCGQRIAQFMLLSYTKAMVRVVNDISSIRPYTERGENGFGSTGIH